MSNKTFERLLEKYKKDKEKEDKILVGFMKLDNGDYATATIKKYESYTKPHMHIDAGDVHVAVRLDKPKYFIHKGYEGKLRDDEIQRLIDMASAKYKDSHTSNFEYASMIFNQSFESEKLDGNQPNYELLNA